MIQILSVDLTKSAKCRDRRAMTQMTFGQLHYALDACLLLLNQAGNKFKPFI